MPLQLRWIMPFLLSVSILFSDVPQTHGAKILIFVFPQPSHVISKLGIGRELIRQGHEVHIALPAGYPQKEAIMHVGIQIILHRQFPGVSYPYGEEYENKLNDRIYSRQADELNMVRSACRDICRSFMEDTDFIGQLRKANYSLIVVEPFAVNPCYLVVPHYLGVPFVSVTSGILPYSFRLPALPAFCQAPQHGTDLTDFLTLQTLRERISNTATTALTTYMAKSLLWGDMTLLQRYAPGIDSWEQLMLRSEMLLLENDHILDRFLPLFPHVVTVAGCSAQPIKPLPESLERIMTQSGDNGVILASFGTSAYRMPANIAIKFLEAYGRLKQTVLTKMAVPPEIKVPDNVHMLPWLPQNDILGHPKTKLFITHCGSNGQYEAVYHGVPMLGIPMFAEQGWNCVRARQRGISLCLDLLEFTSDELHDTIHELINNATYRSNVRKLSEIFRDEPMDGCKKAAFWINHVIKYGSSHLRSPALDQSLYQFLMFDVIGLFLLVTLTVTSIVCLTCMWLVKKCRKRSPKSKKD